MIFTITQHASKLTLILTSNHSSWRCARSRRDASESETTIGVIAMITAVSPVLRCAARALFRFRKSAAAAWRWLGANAKMLAPFSPTRLRSHFKSRRRPIRTYDGTRMPAWQRERTNWCHGLPAESGHGRLSAFHHSGRRRTAKMAKSSLFSAGGHLLHY